ncbi:MAG TPA: sulfotransferase [Verrucomicrobiae bacterium]|jgi:hypothetical protein
MNQCFIISLPRAGSTLLQRLLAAHPRIQTVGEPWLALPFAYALREKGARAEFSHRSMAQGVSEFVKALPGGTATYYREAGRMMERLQETMATSGRDWFLDKTPRYFLILDELAAMFPDAKFIVLQRNPLAVIASILSTWHEGRFNFGSNEIDVYDGPRCIARFVRERRANVYEISYEKLVAEPEKHLRAVTDFLGVAPLSSADLPEDDPLKRAKLGDKTGIHRFSEVSSTPVEAWKKSFASSLRKLWARRYLEWLSDETLRLLGYDQATLLHEVSSLPTSLGQTMNDFCSLRARALTLCCVSNLDFVREDRRDARVRYRWKGK